MDDDSKKLAEHFAALVEVDPNFPGSVLAILSQMIELPNGTMVHLDVVPSALDDQRATIGACADKHVHVNMSMGAPLAVINASIVIGFATALVLDSTGAYMKPPSQKDIADALGALEEATVDTLPELMSFVRANLSTLLPKLFGAPEGGSTPIVH